MKRQRGYAGLLRGINNYFLFFLMVAFLVTCCMMLFVRTLAFTLGISLTSENLGAAAKLTFGNVVLLSLIFTVVDHIRRKWAVDRPVKCIIRAAEQLVAGDFSVRVPHIHTFGGDDRFNEIADCFNKMAQELGSVETLRTDFIANVSHEMKTPLAVMRNYGTMLQQQGLSEEKRIEYAKAVTEGSRRMADMMTNILKLNRLENQQIFPQTTEYDLGEQLCECLLRYENVWEQADIEIETDLEENVRVRADAELLSLVWSNLFSNAFKFTEPGGKVSLTLSATENHAIVKVRDNGCGMSPEIGAHIFEKFYQGDSSRATQGNGLGLALVKRVVDIMQAEISVESALGAGTTFTVKIRRV